MYILWFRHGFSCANYIKATDGLYLIKMPLEADAHLTNIGKIQTESVANSIIKDVRKMKIRVITDVIFTSILTRTIQTAKAIKKSIKKESDLIILPHIEEIPFSFMFPIDRQNQPRNYNILRKDVGKIDVLDSEDLDPYDSNGNPIKRVDVEKFYETVLPTLIESLKNTGYKITKKTAIIIVSHRKTINEATGISIGNTGAVLQEIIINRRLNNDYDIEIGDSEVIFEGFYREESTEIAKSIGLESISNCKSKPGRRMKN